MSSQADPPKGPIHRDQIQLNVISPSVQVQKLTFSGLSTACTIQQLKAKICDSVPIKVAPERQRLIYRGHVLNQDQKTLKDVFTQELVRFASIHISSIF